MGGLFQRIRRQVQGAREAATGQSHQTVAVGPGVAAVRISLPRPCELVITGEDRGDVAIDVRATARGYDQAEARTAADAVTVKQDVQDAILVLTGSWDDRRGPAGFVTQATITVSLPRRLAVRVEPHIGTLSVSTVASLESMGSRGETRLLDVAGDVRVTHGGGPLEIAGGATLKLTARNSHGEVSRIAGVTSIDATGGRLALKGIAGPLDIESRNSDIAIAGIEALAPPLRVNATGGQVRIEDLRADTRIDGRNTDIDVRLAAPAPVTISNQGAITITAPPGGYTLDAAATDGRITSDDGSITATPSDGPVAHASARIRGGGPALTLRATRGRIDIRRAGK